jgi:hypothetical protein
VNKLQQAIVDELSEMHRLGMVRHAEHVRVLRYVERHPEAFDESMSVSENADLARELAS